MRIRRIAIALLLSVIAALQARSQPPARVGPTDEQLTLSDIEVRRLVNLLKLEPGVSIADVGAGLGAWTLRFSQWTGPAGHVYATDIGEEQLTVLRALVTREGLSNVTVLAGATAATNLPDGCCDVILMRNVFHYVAEPAGMIRSLAASLKRRGRLAIVDFPPRPNTTPPPGVPANRGGQGVPAEIVEREVGVVLRHVITVPNWAPEGVPAWVPAETGRPFVAIFEKSK